MIDVHAPHERTHTWRDIVIHLAIVVVGILIAIGLEQTVEYIHHRHQVRETRAALEHEEMQNRRRFALETDWFHKTIPFLQTDFAVLTYLRAHPHAPPSAWPGEMDWGMHTVPYEEAAWRTAQEDGVIEYMPHAEVQRYVEIYTRLDAIRAEELDARAGMEKASGFLLRDPDLTHLATAQIDTVIDNITDVARQLVRAASEQERLHRLMPEFAPAPTTEELENLRGLRLSRKQIELQQDMDTQFRNIDK